MLRGEFATIGYPRAALFGFAMALVSYNTLSVVKPSLRSAFGHEKIESDVFGYYIANEVRATQKGMVFFIEQQAWAPFQSITPKKNGERTRAPGWRSPNRCFQVPSQGAQEAAGKPNKVCR